MIPHIVLVALAGAPLVNGTPPVRPTLYSHRAGTAGPRIELRVSGDEVLRRGERVKVHFRTEVDAYVTIMRVDTDGRVRVLFPRDPWDDNYARGDRNYSVEAQGNHAFVVEDYPGQGYLFGIASADPFDYRAYVRGDHWDYRVIAGGGRIEGDPYAALSDLIDHILPPSYVAYSYDVLPYYVEERYDYPRFLCYECHGYAAFPYWDPYQNSCVRFRIVIYDDPFYYPVRQYGGTQVVYERPVRPVPRYVFKDRTPTDAYVVRERQRPADETGRRRIDQAPPARDMGPSRILVPPPGRVDVRRPSVPQGTRRLLEDESRERGVDSTSRTDQERSGTVRPTTPQREPATRSLPQLERREPRRDDASTTKPANPPRPVNPDDARRTPTTRPPDDRRTEPARESPPKAQTGRATTPPKQTPPKTDPRRKTGN